MWDEWDHLLLDDVQNVIFYCGWFDHGVLYELMMNEDFEFDPESVEGLVVIGLNEIDLPRSKKLIAVGPYSAVVPMGQDIFRFLLGKKQITKVIVTHNHPSGDPTPSREDFESTKYYQDIATTLGYKFIDHIIVGRDSSFSMTKMKGFYKNNFKDDIGQLWPAEPKTYLKSDKVVKIETLKKPIAHVTTVSPSPVPKSVSTPTETDRIIKHLKDDINDNTERLKRLLAPDS